MDILACPYDKKFPLTLIVINEQVVERPYEWEKKPHCEEYCGLKGIFIKEVKEGMEFPCEECIKREIVEGILYCPECGRWYPIKEEIPILLPDEYRTLKEDLEFLEKVKDILLQREPELGKRILEDGKPFNLRKR